MSARKTGESKKTGGGRSQERGAARIQQLVEQVPEMPREMVVKADYLNEGLRQTPIMSEIGRWAIPDAHELYEYGKEHPPQEDGQAGYTLTPFAFYFKNGAFIKVMFDSSAPYEVRYEGRGCYWLYRDGEPIEEVRFAACPEWYKGTTSNGTPMSSVAGMQRDRYLKLVPTTYCEFFKDGNQCQFCNIVPTTKHFVELGQDRILTKREQDVYDIYMAAAQAEGLDGIGISGGAFYNRKKEADLYIRMYEVVKRAMRDSGCVLPLGYASQPQEKEDILRLKEAGVTSMMHSMEVWDPRLFPIVAPGKNKSLGGREHWLECILNAVEIFGKGRVATSFVLGVELVHPSGFKTEEEAAESVLEGFRFFASHGISPQQIPFRTAPGAVLAQAPRPRVEYLLQMELERHKIMKEYNLAGGRGAQQPSHNSHQSFGNDWLDVPKEAIWPPALRYMGKEPVGPRIPIM